MKKELKDFLPFYLGCECERQGEPVPAKLTGISYDDTQKIWWTYFENEEDGYSILEDVRPILRSLSDMTEEEATEGEIWGVWHDVNLMGEDWDTFGFSPQNFKYLLSKGFDLFGLIESGLAVNAAELKTVTE
jgi:hypothetical protein